MDEVVEGYKVWCGDIQRGHYELERIGLHGCEDLVGGIWVGEAVEFCCRGAVAWSVDGASHPDYVENPGEGGWVSSKGVGEIGHWCQRDH